MSNEVDLDWLVRNVHEWPYGMREVLVCYSRNVDTLIWSCVLSNAGWITKEQWLARRAELQGKPSWADHSDAKCFVQNAHGLWFKNIVTDEVEPSGGGWRVDYDGYQRDGFVQVQSGAVLGDWRDTLERRPGMHKSEPKIDTSAERVQKSDESIHDWHERGALPPVGTRCEALSEPDMDWLEVEVIAHRDGFAIVWCSDERCGANCDDPKHFRPIRTEREVLIEIIKKTDDTDDKIADAILAAGFSMRAK